VNRLAADFGEEIDYLLLINQMSSWRPMRSIS